MAHTCNLIEVNSAGSTVTTVALHDPTNGIHLSAYRPTAPDPRVVSYETVLRHGSDVTDLSYPDVNETATVLVDKASTTDITTYHTSLMRFLEKAHMRQRKRRGNRYYVVFVPDGGATTWRAEIKRGSVNLRDTAMDYEWRNTMLFFAVSWLRAWKWESATLTELPLASKATTKATGGVVVYNHWDGDANHATYVEIDDGDIVGTLPAPLYLTYYNSYNNAGRPDILYVTQNETASPTTLNPILEAEDGTWYADGTSPVTLAAATYSNGEAIQNVWTGNDVLLGEWTLSGALLAELAGAPCKIIGRITNLTDAMWIRLEVRYQSVTTLETTGDTQLSDTYALHDLGVLHLPPWNVGDTTPAALTLRLYAYHLTDNAPTFTIDYLHLMPVDGNTLYQSRGYGLAYTSTLRDDELEDRLSVLIGATAAGYFSKTPARDGLHVTPATTQRLYILQGGGGDQIDRTLTVRAYYRPQSLLPL